MLFLAVLFLAVLFQAVLQVLRAIKVERNQRFTWDEETLFYKLSLTKNRLKLKPKWIGCSSKRWRWGNLETGMEMFFLLLLSRWTLSRKKERRRIRSKRKREEKWKWNEELNKKPGTFKKFAWRRKRSFVFWFVDSNEVMRTQMTWWAEWLPPRCGCRREKSRVLIPRQHSRKIVKNPRQTRIFNLGGDLDTMKGNYDRNKASSNTR